MELVLTQCIVPYLELREHLMLSRVNSGFRAKLDSDTTWSQRLRIDFGLYDSQPKGCYRALTLAHRILLSDQITSFLAAKTPDNGFRVNHATLSDRIVFSLLCLVRSLKPGGQALIVLDKPTDYKVWKLYLISLKLSFDLYVPDQPFRSTIVCTSKFDIHLCLHPWDIVLTSISPNPSSTPRCKIGYMGSRKNKKVEYRITPPLTVPSSSEFETLIRRANSPIYLTDTTNKKRLVELRAKSIPYATQKTDFSTINTIFVDQQYEVQTDSIVHDFIVSASLRQIPFYLRG